MPVYFGNAGKMDLDVIRVMGVSIKERDNPIGFFGTGLKFAIATLLRTNHKITLNVGGDEYEFTARTSMIRGEEVKRVFMNEEPLPFTIQLGRTWEVWMAYRELYSNTKDEGGWISEKGKVADTLIKVEGDGIMFAHDDRGAIFLDDRKPICATSDLEVYEGDGSAVFYRGVRAGHMPSGGKFTYNILKDMKLTEDRTFSSQWDVEYALAKAIPQLENSRVLDRILRDQEGFEAGLSLHYCGTPSEPFMAVSKQLYANVGSNVAARMIVEDDQQRKAEFAPAKMTDASAQKFLDSFAVLQKMQCSLSPEDVEVVESLGPSVMAIYHKAKDRIFLAQSTLDWGIETVAATLFEEWLHKDFHYVDKSRELQNYLFQRLVAVAMESDPPAPENQKPANGMPF